MDQPQDNATSEPAGPPEVDGPADLPSGRPSLRMRCSLCGDVVEASGNPGPIDVRCESCGLSFTCILGDPYDEGDDPGEADESIQEAAGPLDRWLAGEPIQPRPVSDWKQLRALCAKRPYLAGLAVVAVVVVALAAAASSAAYAYASLRCARLSHALQEMEERCLKAESFEEESTRIAAVRQEEYEREKAARALAERRRREADELRREADRLLVALEQKQDDARQQVRRTLAGELARQSRQVLESRPIHSLYLAEEAARAMIEQGQTPDPQITQTMHDALWMIGGRGLQGHLGAVSSLAVSSDGRWLLSGSCDATARLWDLTAPNPLASSVVLRGHQGPITAVAITPDGQWGVTAGHDGTARLWDLGAKDPWEAPVVLAGHQSQINAVAVSSDSRWLVTAGGGFGVRDNTARLWDLKADDPAASVSVLRGHKGPVLCAAISPDSHWVVTGSEDKTARRFDLTARYPAAEQEVFEGHSGWVGALAISPDSRWMVTGSYDGTARLWDLTNTENRTGPIVLEGHRGWIGAVAVSPDGRWVATGSYDNTARLWNTDKIDSKTGPIVLEGHQGRIHAVAFSHDGRWLVTGSFDQTARIWDLAREDPAESPIVLRGHTAPVSSLAISPDNRWLATSSGDIRREHDSTVRLWDLNVESLLDSARATATRHLDEGECTEILLDAMGQGGPVR